MESSVYKRIFMSQDSSVGIVTGYGLVGRGSIPSEVTNSPYSTAPRPAVGPTQPPIKWVLGTYPRVKRPNVDADHSPPSSAEVKNVGDIIPLLPTSS
jgi:hypothetical protein